MKKEKTKIKIMFLIEYRLFPFDYFYQYYIKEENYNYIMGKKSNKRKFTDIFLNRKFSYFTVYYFKTEMFQ